MNTVIGVILQLPENPKIIIEKADGKLEITIGGESAGTTLDELGKAFSILLNNQQKRHFIKCINNN